VKGATVEEPKAVSPPIDPSLEPGEVAPGTEAVLAAPRPWPERLVDLGIDRDTLPVLLLILVHVVVSTARGGLTLYSLPIVLWLVVGAGVVLRESWSLALALLLVCLEVTFALFGIAPDSVRGLPAWSPIDFLLVLLRIVTGFLILRMRDQFS
jgi:hypothetical protein